MSQTTGTINVAAVSGTSDIGATTNYTSTLNTTTSAASATVEVVLAGVTLDAGHSLAILTDMPVTLTAGSSL